MNNSASSILARWKNHFTNWREWELNPIVVKELRQAVRSWAVTGMLFLFLLVLFGTALVVLITQSFDNNNSGMMGSVVFSAFISILTLASVIFIPLYIGIRVASERQENNIDLLYVTTLSPGRIIRGKFFCGVYVAVLFFSCCMPFMVFTNLLRGVDLPTIFFNLLVLFLAVCLVVQAAIFFACLPISKPLKIFAGLFALFSLLPFGSSMMFFSFGMMRSGIGTMMVGGHFWVAFLNGFAIGAGIMLLLYFLSVALISPPSANRALPVRLYLTFLWLLTGAIAMFWIIKESQPRMILAWAIPNIIVLLCSLVVVVSNEDELSLRVLRVVPVNPGKRALAFLFYNGAAGGLVWAALLTGATFLVAQSFLNPAGALSRSLGFSTSRFNLLSADDFHDFSISLGSFLLYAFAYALAAVFIHRKFFPRRPAKVAGVFAVLLPAGLAIVLYLGLFFLNRLSWKTIESFQPGNMFNVFGMKDSDLKSLHVYIAAILLILFSALNAKWFVLQMRRFQRYDRNVAAPPVIAQMQTTNG
jgi:hypothetical protein